MKCFCTGPNAVEYRVVDNAPWLTSARDLADLHNQSHVNQFDVVWFVRTTDADWFASTMEAVSVPPLSEPSARVADRTRPSIKIRNLSHGVNARIQVDSACACSSRELVGRVTMQALLRTMQQLAEHVHLRHVRRRGLQRWAPARNCCRCRACPFMPKYHCWPLRVWCICGSRSSFALLVEGGALMIVASKKGPQKSKRARPCGR